MNRKDFLSLSTKAAMFFGLSTAFSCKEEANDKNIPLLNKTAKGSAFALTAPKIDKVNVGIIGCGNRGQVLVQMFDWLIKNDNAEIVAVSDLRKEKTDKLNEHLQKTHGKTAKAYYGTPDEWKKIAERDNIDLLIIATPWEWHTPMALYGMEQGKHVACEVPVAYTLEDCWKLIETAERTQKHCMMLENCCFNNEELWVLNMVNQGVFGDLTHAEGAYIHDLRKHLLDKEYYEDQWRIKHHLNKDGNFYTTHGLGPISQYMDIGRGDTYDHVVSMSSREKSLSDAAKRAGENKFSNIKCGDMNTTMIKTKLGKTIMLQFDVHTGRPYDRLNTVVGTKAVHEGYPSKLYINEEELAWWGHEWLKPEEYKEYREKYNHPLWNKLKSQISDNSVGHGGMDFVMIYRLIKCLNEGLPLDINVYDSVLWSAITPLSELSIAQNSSSVKVPDFTGGTWKNKNKSEMLRDI
ncbi:Gfo/Idh/MocA family protein [Tenacibaculum singaporense]|uniref:Gfo/Idh/MocA family protein n=1 Tax=Tenacibaculum singaporense TaxID=2358479 RepID=UPI000F66A35F|nr:Gfo/Idh/MocA family oxidoreductase [Tenacibaculum singaporense]RSC92699.1 gfo/Idh/MocA family oxidoreductase [Tenacibaculum singaporense]